MTNFENIFDRALSDADERIIDRMGVTALISVREEPVPRPVRGVFDEPENVVLPPGGGRIEDVSPSLFVRSADVTGVHEKARVNVNGEIFWIERLTPDDNGSRMLILVRGEPGQAVPAVPAGWIKK
ncbi:head-tail joining protein [Enterobacter roggenkampii]|uniref:head-tail joining protein n=1 Tax=Enterobacter roggenkampii TaxID=1812935 RepID=UPI0022383682|nr:head-tail joining protein [Enterobacter roggenkampii]MCW5003531.1 head-tail joining protein [Enterobacter roggenkampii]